MLDWNTERAKVKDLNINSPQRQAIGDMALIAAKAAIDQLAGLGIVYDLVDVTPKPQEVPQMSGQTLSIADAQQKVAPPAAAATTELPPAQPAAEPVASTEAKPGDENKTSVPEIVPQPSAAPAPKIGPSY